MNEPTAIEGQGEVELVDHLDFILELEGEEATDD